MNSPKTDHHATCLACGSEITPPLVRAASTRCMDCRDFDAPLRPDLVDQTRAAR